ncbi:SusE domain-containing protein [Rubrolithibacter danxiaensis]|uniref:SusE domain-containing protein n=1 Tax=Rubrolithibacter danxiaensis TaxID=3390805 RepID=UPI003BF8DB08
MKKLINKAGGLIALVLLMAACKKDAVLTTLQEVSFPSSLTASKTDITISEADTASSVIEFAWPEVTYPVDAPVTYMLQIDIAADTIGSSAWGNAANIDLGQDVVSKSLKGGELNTLAQQLGIKPNESGTLVARIKSTLDRPAYSNAVSFTVTPYKVFTGYPSLWVPGDYQGWDPASAPTIVSVKSDNVYEGYVYIPAGGSMQFKFTAQPAWEPMAYGTLTNDGTLAEANFAGGNFTAPSDGYYDLTADLNQMKYTITKTTWSIIGDATPGGWDSDTQMDYDPVNKVWKVTADMSANGSFKFRANNAWVIDFGVDGNGKLTYADHPVLGYTPDLNNLTVPENGNYTITLDLHDPNNYSYKLKKN